MFIHHLSKFGKFSLKIGGEIIVQSLLLLTPFFNLTIVHWKKFTNLLPGKSLILSAFKYFRWKQGKFEKRTNIAKQQEPNTYLFGRESTCFAYTITPTIISMTKSCKVSRLSRGIWMKCHWLESNRISDVSPPDGYENHFQKMQMIMQV